jgi:hypothetical protein
MGGGELLVWDSLLPPIGIHSIGLRNEVIEIKLE